MRVALKREEGRLWDDITRDFKLKTMRLVEQLKTIK